MISALEVLNGQRLWSADRSQVLRWLRKLPDKSVHLIVTSPPYYAMRDYGVSGQIGLEKTPSLFIAKLVKIFRECRRVLRDDGVMYVNIGDTYHVRKGQAGGQDVMQPARAHFRKNRPSDARIPGLKPKDLIGIPWMLAIALREDGWYLRQELIWEKPNVMPGSAQDRFCTNHEQIFLFTKSRHYFFDLIPSQEKATTKWAGPPVAGFASDGKHHQIDHTLFRAKRAKGKGLKSEKIREHMDDAGGRYCPQMRNKRTVWRISTQKSKIPHFAMFPTKLIVPMVLSALSERGCCRKCGRPAQRIIRKLRVPTRPGLKTKLSIDRSTGQELPLNGKPWAAAEVGNRDPKRHITVYETIGWKTCDCAAGFQGCVLMDPFVGTGTSIKVAVELGHRAIGCDLNADYVRYLQGRMAGTTIGALPEIQS